MPVAPPAATAEPDDARRVSWLLGAFTGLGIAGSSAVAVVLPTAAADLQVSRSAAAWVLSGYALMLAVLTPVFGRLGDRFGIRRPLVVGLVVMSAGALAAAAAPGTAVLVGARLAQGAGAASVTVLGAALVSRRYSGPVRAGVLASVAGIGAALSAVALLAGGALEAAVGWRPVVALPALALLLVVPVARIAPAAGGGGRIDTAGAAFVTATAGGVILLAQAPSSSVAVAVAGAGLLLAGLPLLAHRVRRHPEGFLPRRVLGDRAVITAAVGAAGLPAAWFALLVVVPDALAGRGWSPLAIGAALVPAAAAALVATRTSRPVLTRLGTRTTLLLSAVAAVAALLLGALGLATSSPVLLVAATLAVAVGFTHGQPAMLAQVGASTGEDVRGVALGVAALVFLTGGATGSALVGGLQGLVPGWAVLLATTALPLVGTAVLARTGLRRPARTAAGVTT
ncbi:MFS transporter [Quadrisphaera sp. DSM 44207]|uniref:MFS transporter n=1 Tax=Quadrisphaera sp. DSM 44207 TaxID=1881057 RepID=UPI00088FEF2F|nr:MFS transporter [Quadrisphaera sp. DSM 44207]SDQ44639.1 Major Facilitator Superfamily protein [Quadrisphaera sp. DSM 44207]